MSSVSSRDRRSPLFKRLNRPKAPDTELNQGKEKLTGQQGKSGKSHTDSDEKQRNSKRGKTDAGENQGNCGGNSKLEIIWSCDDGKLARDCILNLGWHTTEGAVGGTEINEGIQINITFSFSN